MGFPTVCLIKITNIFAIFRAHFYKCYYSIRHCLQVAQKSSISALNKSRKRDLEAGATVCQPCAPHALGTFEDLNLVWALHVHSENEV